MKKIAALLLLAASAPALAHPGHGTQNPLSPGHYVSNPEHSIPLTLAIGTAVVVAMWLMYRRQHTSR